MSRYYGALVLPAMAMFAVAPFLIHNAPYESTMGLVQKIFYFHVPSAMMMFLAAFTCGIASAFYLLGRRQGADRLAGGAGELTVVFGMIVLVTGPLWARKAWGVWWQWDARLTSSLLLWMIFVAYLLVRRYGGPGSEKLAAAMALFGMANVPFVYVSVNIWRTLHPKTSVVPDLPAPMMGPFLFSAVAFLLLFAGLLAARVSLERAREQLEQVYREADDT
ncbi:MAG: cytochrome c biogenesis protein [Vicinamibacterales bacterium]